MSSSTQGDTHGTACPGTQSLHTLSRRTSPAAAHGPVPPLGSAQLLDTRTPSVVSEMPGAATVDTPGIAGRLAHTVQTGSGQRTYRETGPRAGVSSMTVATGWRTTRQHRRSDRATCRVPFPRHRFPYRIETRCISGPESYPVFPRHRFPYRIETWSDPCSAFFVSCSRVTDSRTGLKRERAGVWRSNASVPASQIPVPD